MFTGIVQRLGTVASIHELTEFRKLAIVLGNEGDAVSQNIQLGASIAINGTCLTVKHVDLNADDQIVAYFDVIDQTLSLTNIGTLNVGDKVNIERSLKFGDELGGHQVSGHIDLTATIISILQTENNRRVHFQLADADKIDYIVEQGYISVDGISLTVVSVDYISLQFSVALIPETLDRTTLGVKQVNDLVNVEFDNVTKTIVIATKKLIPQLAKKHLQSISH